MKPDILIPKEIEALYINHPEPQRQGVPKGHKIGFGFSKMKAAILRGIGMSQRQIALEVNTSRSMVGVWCIEPEFKQIAQETYLKTKHLFEKVMIVIGRSEGYEDAFSSLGEKHGINYFDPKLDMLWDIHPDGHWGGKLMKERANAIAADMPLMTMGLYPLQDIMAEFGTDYFSSSTDYLVAWAIHNKYDRIELFGCAMDDKGDHLEKRAGLDFWCGVAIGRGIKVVVHGNSTVMTTSDGKTYGLFTPMSRHYEPHNDAH